MQRVIESAKKYDDKVSTARRAYFGEILWLYQFYNIGLVELDKILSLVDDEKKSCWDKFALKDKDGRKHICGLWKLDDSKKLITKSIVLSQLVLILDMIGMVGIF